MLRKLDRRAGHYGLLLLAWAALCLPNLGGPSLWDIDEGNNSEAAREMWRADNWIVPTCNYRLREDKPALIYWLQGAGYAAFGLGEFAARLPSALAALAAMLGTYELGRRMFSASSGLLAGLLLGTAVMFCAAAHFANPDSLLNACTLFALFFFWRDYAAGRRGWSPWCGAAAGLGVLAKGPVGLVLPAAVALLFLLWRRELRRLWSLRVLTGLLAFVLVAAPWYVWVTVETKAAWTVGFWTHHNVNRFTGAMESHTGPFYYYVGAMLVGCAPWCVFFGPTAWYAARRLRTKAPSPQPLSPEGRGAIVSPLSPRGRGAIVSPLSPRGRGAIVSPLSPRGRGVGGEGTDERSAVQFLLCWMAVYLLFFSASTTKLPNYILPLYPAAALLTGRFLDQWRRGEANTPGWLTAAGLACLALIGVGATLGLMAAGGGCPCRGCGCICSPAWNGTPASESRCCWARRSRRGSCCGGRTAPPPLSLSWRRRWRSRRRSRGAPAPSRRGRRPRRWPGRCRPTRRGATCGWRPSPITSLALSFIVSARRPA